MGDFKPLPCETLYRCSFCDERHCDAHGFFDDDNERFVCAECACDSDPSLAARAVQLGMRALTPNDS